MSIADMFAAAYAAQGRATYPKEVPDDDDLQDGTWRTVYVPEDELTDDDLAALTPVMRAEALAERARLNEECS